MAKMPISRLNVLAPLAFDPMRRGMHRSRRDSTRPPTERCWRIQLSQHSLWDPVTSVMLRVNSTLDSPNPKLLRGDMQSHPLKRRSTALPRRAAPMRLLSRTTS